MEKFVFYFFCTFGKWKNSLSINFYTFTMLLKPSIKVPSLFSILFRLVKTFYREKRPNGVSFKLFWDSINMKILSSTCLLHTSKIIWRVVSPTVGYLFFGLDGLFTKKEHSSQPWLEEFSKVWFYTFSGLRD